MVETLVCTDASPSYGPSGGTHTLTEGALYEVASLALSFTPCGKCGGHMAVLVKAADAFWCTPRFTPVTADEPRIERPIKALIHG